MDAPKEKYKITSRKELEFALDWVILDCWLDFPYDRNLTCEEDRDRYNKYVRDEKLEILKADFDICLDDEKPPE